MYIFLSYVLSLICEPVLCLELVFADLGQAHYKENVLLLLLFSRFEKIGKVGNFVLYAQALTSDIRMLCGTLRIMLNKRAFFCFVVVVF